MLIKFLSFFLFFFSFLFSSSIQVFDYRTSSLYSCVSVKDYSHSDEFIVGSGYYDLYYNNVYYSCSLIQKYSLNFDCLNAFNSSISLQYTDSDIYPNTYNDSIYINPVNLDYCSNCPTFSSVSNLCYDQNNSPLCPSGYIFSNTYEKCVFDCSDTHMQEIASQKCGGSQFVKSYSCSSQDANYSITCYTCADIMNLVSQFCAQNGYSVKDGLSCQAVDDSVSLNFPFPNFSVSDVCNVTNDTNDTNNTDVSFTDTNLTSLDSNDTNDINTTNLTSLDSNDTNDINSTNITSLSQLSDLLNSSNTQLSDINSSLSDLANINKSGFSQLHSDLSDINSSLSNYLSDINSSFSVFSKVSDLINDSNSSFSNIKSDLISGISKYKDYDFVSSDSSTSDICLKDVSFTLYNKTITLKVSQIADSIYVKIVKAILWLSASLLIFFTCFRTD